MSTVLIHNPALASNNQGDYIIEEASKNYLRPLFVKDFWTEIPTHLPVIPAYAKHIYNAPSVAFVLGTNLLGCRKFRRPLHPWEFNILVYGVPSILLGVGWRSYQHHRDAITRQIYKKILSSEYLHSVRDDYTLEKLFDLGITNVINTGCPTIWGFTSEFVDGIKVNKATNVVTTLTDYNKDPNADSSMLNTLSKNYKNVYLWPQGEGDSFYFHNLKTPKNITMLSPHVSEFDNLLQNDDVEYIGTRLHGGIRALQHGKRTLILAVDNRALEMHRSFNIPVLPREDVAELEKFIFPTRKPGIVFDKEPANRFLRQFA